MKFKLAEPSEAYTPRLVSDGGIWEIGLHQVMYGKRVAMGRCGTFCYTVELCCGPDPDVQVTCLAWCIGVLADVPETATTARIQQLLPEPVRRPLIHDPEWRERLGLTAPTFNPWAFESIEQK